MVFPRKDGHRSPSLTSLFSCTLFLYWSESEICSVVADSLQTTDYTIERVTGRKARGLQTEEIGCKCQTFLSLLSSKRKQTAIFFLPEASLPALDGVVDRLYTKSFSFPVGLCPLPMQVSHLLLRVLPPRRGGNAPGVDLMASLTDVQLFTSLASDATQGAIRVTFWDASQAKTSGKNICHLSVCARPWIYSRLQ